MCIDSEATPGSGQPLQVIVPPQSGVTENTFVTVAAAPNCVYKVGVETQNNSTTTINTVLTNISSCLQICNTYTTRMHCLNVCIKRVATYVSYLTIYIGYVHAGIAYVVQTCMEYG